MSAEACLDQRPLRVLVVTNMYPSEHNPALGTFVHEQVCSLRALGTDVEVLFVNGPRSKINYLWGVFRFLWHVLRYGARYDLIHAHYVFSGLIARMQLRLPIVLTHHGIEVIWGWQGVLSRWVSRWVDRLIVTSQAVASSLAVPNLLIIPCGVDLDMFRPMPREEARRRLDLPLEQRIVLYAGRRGPEKRLDVIEEAIRVLRADDPRVRLLMLIGEPHDVVPLYLNAADVLVLASEYEGSPVVVKEALACNLPVVSVDVGDAAMLIEGVDGCHLCERTPQDMARKLRLVLGRGDRVEGREAVRALSLDVVAERVREVYRDVLLHRRGCLAGRSRGG